ncbi:MAG: hypothetical protein JNN12_15050 [Bacteroidetes Order II. Incertae sedis bacterium]|nr:hypothetical protein [Bacteroidetes Order II. bacterium]
MNTTYRFRQCLWVGILLFCLGLLAPVWAQKAWLEATVDSVQNGQRFELTFLVQVGTGQKLIPPPIGKQLGDTDLLREVAREKSRTNNGPEVTAIRFESAVFGVDSVQVRLPFGLVAGQDTLWQETAPLVLIIQGVVPKQAQELKDITPITAFGTDWMFWIWMGLALFILGLAGWWIWRKYWRKTEQDHPLPEPIPVLTLFERALTRLQALASWELTDQERIKAYYTEISEVVRMYLEKSLRIPALESTTGELLARLKAKEDRHLRIHFSPLLIGEIDSLLSLSDLVKFADFQPTPAVHPQALKQAIELLTTIEQLLHPVVPTTPSPPVVPEVTP